MFANADLDLIFKGWLPNFKECWWDHLFLDVLGMNLLGMFIGSRIVQFAEMREYRWASLREIPSKTGKLKRIAGQFFPLEWTTYTWDALGSGRKFFAFVTTIVTLNAVQISAFYLKFILYVPPENTLNHWRLGWWAFFGMPFVREFYIFCVNPEANRLGQNAWLGMATIVAELALIFKFAPAEIAASDQQLTWTSGWGLVWVLNTALLAAFSILHFAPSWLRRNCFDYSTVSPAARKAVDTLLIVAVVIPCVMGVYELVQTMGYCNNDKRTVFDGCADSRLQLRGWGADEREL